MRVPFVRVAWFAGATAWCALAGSLLLVKLFVWAFGSYEPMNHTLFEDAL